MDPSCQKSISYDKHCDLLIGDRQTDKQANKQTDRVCENRTYRFFWAIFFLYFFIDERSNNTQARARTRT